MKTKLPIRTVSMLVETMLLVFIVHFGHAQGTLRQHLGATDPVSEGFTLYTSPGGTVGPVTSDAGRDSWSVVSQGTPVGYVLSLTAAEQASIGANDIVFSAAFRIVQSPNVWLGLYTPSQRFEFSFDSQLDGDPVVSTGFNPVFALEGGGPGYHDYQLFYHATTEQVALWVDGVERVSDITGTAGSSGWGGLWGAAQGTDSQANWNRVSFEIIPEPSSLALLGCGGVLLCACLLRRGRKR